MLPAVVVPLVPDAEPRVDDAEQRIERGPVSVGKASEERGHGLPADRGEGHCQPERPGHLLWRAQGVAADSRDVAVRAGVRAYLVALQCPVERLAGAGKPEPGDLGQQRHGPQVRVVLQPPPAVGRERGEAVFPGRELAGGAVPERVAADRLGAVAVLRGDLGDGLARGVLGDDQLGPVAGQDVRHRAGVFRGGGACAVMSTATWSRLLRVSFSVPSRMAWQDASRSSQSRLPIMPRVRRCR